MKLRFVRVTMKNLNKSKVFTFITLILLSLSFASCSNQNSFVKDVQVSSTVDDSEVYVSVSAELNLGNVSLSDVTLPIFVPRTGQEIGMISIFRNMEGKNILDVDLNVSQIANIDAIAAKLPNGNVLPLIRENSVIVIPIQSKAKIYLAFADGVAALGVTVNISGLDSIGRSVGNISVFPSFAFGNVLGSAGLYNSRTAGQNGFGIFMDISNVIDTNDLLARPTTRFAARSGSSSVKSIAPRESLVLDYNSIKTSRSKRRKLDKKLYRLHRKRATLK
jgi:hypothetical protein